MAQCTQCKSEINTQSIFLVDGIPHCGSCRAELDEYALESTSMARRFDPITVFQSLDGTQYDFPGRSNAECPAGYKPIIIDSIRAHDQFVRRFNAVEGEKGRNERALNHLYFDQRTKERRDNIRAKIRGNAKAEALFREVCAHQDARRSAKRSAQMRWEPNGNFQVFSRDAGNRQPWNDVESGWKSIKS
jgi:hypothetical protein